VLRARGRPRTSWRSADPTISAISLTNLGLTLVEAKLLLAGVQREVVAAQARTHAVRRPDCRCGSGVCHVKDYRDHAIATLFGQITVRAIRFWGGLTKRG